MKDYVMYCLKKYICICVTVTLHDTLDMKSSSSADRGKTIGCKFHQNVSDVMAYILFYKSTSQFRPESFYLFGR